jgi:hypothetical protein
MSTWKKVLIDGDFTGGDGIAIQNTTTGAIRVDLKPAGGLDIESGQLALDLSDGSITGTLAVGDGGTGLTSIAKGSILVANAANTLSALSGGVGEDGYVLTYDETADTISWAAGASGSLEGLSDTAITSAASGQVLIYDDVAGKWENNTLTDGDSITITEGDGTVTISVTDASVTNAKLANASTTLGSTALTLGQTTTSIAGMTAIDYTAANGTLAANIGANTLTIGGAASTVSIAGTLEIQGDINQITTTELVVTDKTIRTANGATTTSGANGAGLAVDTSGITGWDTDAAIKLNTTVARFSEWEMIKGSTSSGGNSFIAGMVQAADTTALDALDPGIGTLGMVVSGGAGVLYIQTA